MKEEIVKQKIVIDTKIVSNTYRHGDNSTRYCTFKSGTTIEDGKLTKGYCFSNLLSMLKNNKDHNKVYYKMEEDVSQSVKLTETEKHEWIELCTKYKTMPGYITKNDIDKKTMIIEVDDENVTPSLLFIYLCCFRYFREDPGFIKAVVYLVNNLKMNYYAAFVLASRICMSYNLHHILNTVRLYSEKFEMDNVTVPLNVMMGLSRIVNDPKKYDTRGPRDYNNTGGFNQFRCASNINNISKIKYECLIQDLFDKNIIEAIMAPSDKMSQKHLDKFISYKDKIVYKEKSANK